MSRMHYLLSLGLLAWLALPATVGLGHYKQEATVQASTAVLNEIMSIPLQRIPRKLLADAQGIAIIPNVIKGGFVVGARYVEVALHLDERQ